LDTLETSQNRRGVGETAQIIELPLTTRFDPNTGIQEESRLED